MQWVQVGRRRGQAGVGPVSRFVVVPRFVVVGLVVVVAVVAAAAAGPAERRRWHLWSTSRGLVRLRKR